MTKSLILIFTSVFLGVIGQLSMKNGMMGVRLSDQSPGILIGGLVGALANPYVIGGIGLYACSALVWLMVLSRVDLSFAYPLVSTGYIAVVLLSRFLFHESVTPVRIVGALVICAGVVLITRS
jgi:drug/metabolite transporter (DMT)-like permease